jgi:hypothetical protein
MGESLKFQRLEDFGGGFEQGLHPEFDLVVNML